MRILLLLALFAFGLSEPALAQTSVLGIATGTTAAQPAATSTPSAADLQNLVTTLQDDKQRAQLIAQLQALISAQKSTQPAPTAAPSIQTWTAAVIGWFQLQSVRRLAGDLASIVLVIVIALLVWVSVNAAVRRALAHGDAARSAQVNARLKTLLPLVRSTVLIAVVTVAGIIVLSQLGMNVAPLLAGAGIIGIAIGLGSQQLVRDVINGLFILIENTIVVGDYVDVGGGHAGNVEELSIRSMKLRDGNGAVHTIPFSAVTMIVNTNRGVGNAAVSVALAPGQDSDRAAHLLAEIAAAMRQDPAFKAQMLSDLQYWGVDKVDGSAVTLVGQIVCTDSGRWPVQREFNRRVMLRFEAEGIAFAVPTQSVIVHEPDRTAALHPADTPQVTPLRAPRDRA